NGVVVSLLAASVMQKMAPHCSFARWLLCNGSLHRYKHPSDEELCALAGKQRPKAKRDRRMNGMTDDKPLSVPRDIDLRLDTSPITAVDALGNRPNDADALQHANEQGGPTGIGGGSRSPQFP
uniref:Transmembrane protein 161A n=1 Tax=Buteo japonicus TaxID=224669 RepID=A0A8C0AYI5_9AVES